MLSTPSGEGARKQQPPEEEVEACGNPTRLHRADPERTVLFTPACRTKVCEIPCSAKSGMVGDEWRFVVCSM